MATNNSVNEPTAATGKVLQGAGVGTTSAFSTATYPATATGTGTILRADGTNWSATTTTYPNTNAVSTILYASSANVMGALATANSGVLATNASGVPSIDTTNFAVLSTGLQLKGNGANTAPPSGFIGEQIRSAIASASSVASLTTAITNVTSIVLTAGIWDISGLIMYTGMTTATLQKASVNTTSATIGTIGDNAIQSTWTSTTAGDFGLSIPAWRLLTTGSSTTVYLVGEGTYTAGTGKLYGRISATRVG